MRERNYNIDILKGFAIISVVILHTLSWDHRFIIGAPYHFWQAVPIFMLLVGYNLAMSSKIKGLMTYKDVYQWPFLKKRLKRILIAYLVIALVRIILEIFVYEQFYLFESLVGALMGSFEHGGYYIPIMIQAIFVTPLLYAFIQKNRTKNGLILLVSMFILDWVVMLFEVSSGIYRILIVRYLFAIVLGIWFALIERPLNKKVLGFLASMSFIYITVVYYFGIETPLEQYWQVQHAPAYFWTLFIVALVLKVKPLKSGNVFNNTMIKLGQNSYHIFLVQMIYFWIIGLFNFSLSPILAVVVNLIICLIGGLWFKKIDDHLFRY